MTFLVADTSAHLYFQLFQNYFLKFPSQIIKPCITVSGRDNRVARPPL